MSVRVLVAIILLTSISAFGQHRIKQLHDFENPNAPTKKVTLFDQLSNSDLVLNLDKKVQIAKLRPNHISIPITLHGKKTDLLLERVHILPDNIFTSSGLQVDLTNHLTYRGTILGSSMSWATMLISEDLVKLTIADEQGNYEILPLKKGHYQLVDAADYEHFAYLSCNHPNDSKSLHSSESAHSRMSPSDCADIYVEVDHQTYNQFTDASAATSWAVAIFSDVATIYDLAGVSLQLSDMKVWDTPDPYTASDLVTKIDEFTSTLGTNGFQGKIAHLFTSQDLGGGISAGIGGFCNNHTTYPAPYALTGNMTPAHVGYPVYSYNVMNVAHELGHVFGLRHTHACVWNGNNTQIDDCGNVYASQNNQTLEGEVCFDNTNPILPPSGTVMSYCHLVQGNSINLANGFHPLVKAQLFNNFVGASCQLSDDCGSNPPINDYCVNAIPLTASNTCIPKEYDNVNSTDSGVTSSISCSEGEPPTDVWFSVVVPPSGNITIESTQLSGGLVDLVGQAFTGVCGSLTEIMCDNTSGSGFHFKLEITGQVPGESLLIRVLTGRRYEVGNFGICAYDPSLPCHPDLAALVDLYNSTNGASWVTKTGWLEGAAGNDCDVCTWHGVICDDQERVSIINLANNNLSGPIPPSISSLSALTRLRLYGNMVTGGVPSNLDQLPLLNLLDLGSNPLGGILPSSLGNCTNLRTLYLDQTLLTGTLPSSLANAPLTSIWFQNNNLQGCIPSTFSVFCDRNATLRLDNNVGLPLQGNYDAYCADGTGGDQDMDGYCAIVEDCIDTDPLTYPGAPEICDGIDNDCDDNIDEGVSTTVNNWIGTTNNTWSEQSNWSTGYVPAACHDVVISGSVYDTVFVRAFEPAVAASVSISSDMYLWVQNHTDLSLSQRGGITNSGHLVVIGDISITDLTYPNNGLTNELGATTEVKSTGRILLSNAGTVSLYNQGLITNQGVINVSSTTGQGVSNSGTILNQNTFSIFTPNGIHLTNFGAGFIDLENGSYLTIRR